MASLTFSLITIRVNSTILGEHAEDTGNVTEIGEIQFKQRTQASGNTISNPGGSVFGMTMSKVLSAPRTETAVSDV